VVEPITPTRYGGIINAEIRRAVEVGFPDLEEESDKRFFIFYAPLLKSGGFECIPNSARKKLRVHGFIIWRWRPQTPSHQYS